MRSDFRLEEGGFACFCTASDDESGAWTSRVRFERVERPKGEPRLITSHKVPGVFLDCGSALSAAAAYAVRTVQWKRV